MLRAGMAAMSSVSKRHQSDSQSHISKQGLPFSRISWGLDSGIAEPPRTTSSVAFCSFT